MDYGIVIAVAQIAAVTWVWSLAQELVHTPGMAKKEKKKKKNRLTIAQDFLWYLTNLNKELLNFLLLLIIFFSYFPK